MPKNIHKGTELNNVRETWEKNEREQGSKAPGSKDENLDKTIQEEASEYENASKSDRLLSGERASVNDDDSDS